MFFIIVQIFCQRIDKYIIAENQALLSNCNLPLLIDPKHMKNVCYKLQSPYLKQT